jgi:hypothetical protein
MSVSLLEVNLSYVKFPDVQSDISELFKGLGKSQTMQSLHLEGLNNSVSNNLLAQLELSYL